MLSTNISIDATEYDTGTAAAPPVIETNGGAYTVATVAEGDIINVEIASTGTGATYFEVVLVFRLP
jgi:hypothetical protein